MEIGTYVLVAIVVMVLIFVKMTIVIIPQSETKIIERLGRYYATLKPGINIIIPFNEDIIYDEKAEGNGTEMENLYQDIEACDAGGGTNMYTAILQGMDDLASYGKDYNRAIVVMTDGESMEDYDELQERVEKDGSQIPVFSIMYGDADKRQLEKIADLTNARVFDGRDSLTDAFRKVKGYN